jgi:hypothetical protein
VESEEKEVKHALFSFLELESAKQCTKKEIDGNKYGSFPF